MHGLGYDVIETFDHYHTTKLGGTFINHRTRKEALHTQYLLKILQAD
jgi:hypothetical protein